MGGKHVVFFDPSKVNESKNEALAGRVDSCFICLRGNTKTSRVESRWHNPQKVVHMDPYIKDILGFVPSTLNHLCTCCAFPSPDRVELGTGSIQLRGRRVHAVILPSDDVTPGGPDPCKLGLVNEKCWELLI